MTLGTAARYGAKLHQQTIASAAFAALLHLAVCPGKCTLVLVPWGQATA